MIQTASQPKITKELWGQSKGKDIWLFCLQNRRNTRLYVSNYGAVANALFVPNRQGIYEDVLLGYDQLSDYEQDDYYIGSVVGRYANRIRSGEVMIEGKKYQLATRPGGYHLHGGDEGFNKKVFDFKILDTSDVCSIQFSYVSDDMEEGFPGSLKLEVIYTLDQHDRWTVEYFASSSKTTLVNLTQHAYFNLTGDARTTIGEHELRIPADYYLPVNAMQVPTGTIAPVAGTPFDFRSHKPIAKELFVQDEQLILSHGYDHSFVLEEKHTGSLKHAAVVKEQVSGRQLDVYTTEPAVHLYTGNFLDVKGKNGVQYGKHSGFCLETQHFPDAPNHPHFPSTVLKEDEQFYSKTVFQFSTF